MKVSELIALLDKFNPNAQVILQKDAEGNGYSPLSDVDDGLYNATSTWSGDFYPFQFSADENGFEDHEWAQMREDDTLQAVVLAPIN